MITVFHVGKYFPPVAGGIEILLKRLLDATAGEVRNIVVTANDGPVDRVDRYEGYEVHRIARKGVVLMNPVLPRLPAFIRGVLREGVEIIALHFPNLMAMIGYFLVRPFRGGKEKLLVFYHSEVVFDRFPWNVMGRIYYRLEKVLLSRADRIVVASPNMARQSPQLPGFHDKVSLVHYAMEEGWVDLSDAQREEADAIRRIHGDRIVLFVGRLVPYKGIDVLLSAAREIRGKILILGDGPLKKRLAARIREEELGDKVVLPGNVQDLKPYYAACSVFTLPSISHLEAFGIVQMEAMAFGKPSVTSDLPTGVTYINLPGETGLAVPVGNSGKLAEAVNRLLDDDELRSRMGERARRRVLTEFSPDAIRRQAIALYRDLLVGH